MKAYKALNPDFTCRDYQFEVGKTYEQEGPIVTCSNGFHACENPFDVLNFYSIHEARFAEVNLAGEIVKDSDNSKVAAAKITIEAEISLPDFVTKCVDWVIAQTKTSKKAMNNSAQIGSSGDSAKIGSSGDYAQIGSSGDYAKIGSSGDYAQIGSSGHSAKIGSSGHSAKIGSSGDYGVIAAAGPTTQAKGADGTWISLAEFKKGKCVGFATGKIGENGLKANTYYHAKDGSLVEVSP